MSIKKWTECPECSSSLEFKNYREDPLVCTSYDCDFSERDSLLKNFTDFMKCPKCDSTRIDVRGGYREDRVYCKSCDSEEGDFSI